MPPNCPENLKSAQFLLEKQHEDGGWGEDFHSCHFKKWIDTSSQSANTAWAVMTLMSVDHQKYKQQIQKAIKFLMNRQLPWGEYPDEEIKGVFNGSCAIAYDGYKTYFAIMAIGILKLHN